MTPRNTGTRRPETGTTRQPSQGFVGELGQTVEVTGFVNFVTEVASPYGERNLYLMRDAEGHTVRAFGVLRRVEKGDRIRISGEVKRQDAYNGEDRTELSKIKLLENLSA